MLYYILSLFIPICQFTISYKMKYYNIWTIIYLVQIQYIQNRSLRYGHNIRAHSKGLERVPPSELPLPQTSTLRSRRRLANMLVAASIVFVFCWSPHVVCFLCFELNATNKCSKTVSEYSLLLGEFHCCHWMNWN